MFVGRQYINIRHIYVIAKQPLLKVTMELSPLD